MLQYISKILFVVSFFGFLGTICVGLIYRKNRELNPIRLSFLVALIFMIWEMFIPETTDGVRTRALLLNLSALVDLVIVYFYFWHLVAGYATRIIMQCCFLVLFSVCMYYWISPQHGWKTFMPVLYGIQDLFYTIPCLLYIYEIFKSEEEVEPKTNPHFYVACGLLFFNATTFPFHMSYKTLYDITPKILLVLNSVQSFLSIIMYITIVKAFLCPYPERKSSLS